VDAARAVAGLDPRVVSGNFNKKVWVMSTYATSARTRQALITAGGELFAEKGLDAVSTRAIADRAGENIGSIHYHFKNKEGLIKAIMEFIMSAWKDKPLVKCWEKYESTFDDPRQRAAFIREFIDIHFERIYFSDLPHWCGRMFYQCMTHRNDKLRDFFDTLRRPHHDLFMKAAKRLHPEFNEMQAFVWVHHLMGQITHYAMLAPMINTTLDFHSVSRDDFLKESRRQIISQTLADLGLENEIET
jgi:AcrR family transcriptional regulator